MMTNVQWGGIVGIYSSGTKMTQKAWEQPMENITGWIPEKGWRRQVWGFMV